MRVTLENNERFEFTLVPDGKKQNVQMTSLTTGLDRDTKGRLTFKGSKNVLVTQVEGFKDTTRPIHYEPKTNPSTSRSSSCSSRKGRNERCPPRAGWRCA